MYDIWINEIMTEEQQKRTQLAERYNEQTMGRADKDYEYILLMNPFVSTPDLRKFITHQAAATDPRDIDQETYGRKPTGKRYWKRNIQRQRTITLYEQKAEDSATSGTRQRLSRGTAAKDFDFIVDTGATDTTVPDHLIGQTEYATTFRQTDKPIIVQASNGGTDLIKQVGLIGRHRIQVTPESYREALLSVDQLIKQHGYNVLFSLNDLQLIPAHLPLADLTPADVIRIPRNAARKEWRLSMQTLANLPAVAEDNRTRTTSTYQDHPINTHQDPTAAKTAILIYSTDPVPQAQDNSLQPTDSSQPTTNIPIPVQAATNPT